MYSLVSTLTQRPLALLMQYYRDLAATNDHIRRYWVIVKLEMTTRSQNGCEDKFILLTTALA